MTPKQVPVSISKTLLLVGVCLVPILPKVAHAADEPAKYTGLPYGGKVASLPGIIQTEAYDVAPEATNGISFNYNGTPNKGNLRTTGDAIGLAKFGNGHVSIKGEPENADQIYAGWTHTGEWFKYTVHVNESGVYQFGGHFSAADKGGTISATFTSPTTAAPITTGPVEIPTTAGYQPNVEVYHVWETLDNLAEINLPKGDYVLTVKIEKNAGINLDYFSFNKKP